VAQGGVRLFTLPITRSFSLAEPCVGQTAAIVRGCIDQAMENSQIETHLPGREHVVTD
jgi:hypothetical protein